MCLICEQYLRYVQNVVNENFMISNLQEIFIQANPQGTKRFKTSIFSRPSDVTSISFPE